MNWNSSEWHGNVPNGTEMCQIIPIAWEIAKYTLLNLIDYEKHSHLRLDFRSEGILIPF